MAITERVEFESDGLRDSLTGTLAPARFMELLEQEIQVADREKRSIRKRVTGHSGIMTSTGLKIWRNPP